MEAEEIERDLEEIRPDLDEISPDLEEIRPDLDEISPDLYRSDKMRPATTPIGGELKFRCVFRSGRLNIGFSGLNPLTDPPVSGFLDGDPLPTVASVGLVGFRAGSARLGGSRVWLDTPNCYKPSKIKKSAGFY